MKMCSRIIAFLSMSVLLFAGPINSIAFANDSFIGLIQRLMVGTTKNCQLTGSNQSFKAISAKKSAVEIESQTIFNQLVTKNSPASISASMVLKAAQSQYSINKAAAVKVYETAVTSSATSCSTAVSALKSAYDLAIASSKNTSKSAKQSANPKSGKKTTQESTKVGTEPATEIFKAGASVQLNNYQVVVGNAFNAYRSRISTLDAQLREDNNQAKTAL